MPDRDAGSLSVGPEGAALSQGLRIAVHDDRDEQLTARSFVVGDDPNEWPSSYSYVGTYPRARGRIHSLQGITHDERYWYIAWGYYTPTLSRIPIGADLAVAEPDLTVDSTNWFGDFEEISHYDHFGALHYFDGLLYMAVDMYADTREDHPGPPLLVKCDPGSLVVVQYGPVHPTQLNAGWAAVNPVDGRLYTGFLMDGVLRLYVHDRNSLAVIESYFLLDSAGQPFAAANSQGGAFSPIGHFYFSESDPNNLHRFDMVEKRHMGSFGIQAGELEGVTLADMDVIFSACTGEEACEAGRLRGQIHVADNTVDGIILHHIEVPASEEGKL